MNWNIEPTLVNFRDLPIVGSIPILQMIELRYYGIFFALGLLLCAWRAPQNFDAYRLPREHAERLTLWVPVGMLLGAHYIHLMFYETEGLFDFPHLDAQGNFVLGRFFGLGSGLASHGGGLGCFLALLLFWQRNGRPLGFPFWRYTDAVMVTSVWVYPFVRLGNFFNSEILGRPTDSMFGVVFERVSSEPRHPVVLYEAAMYFAEIAIAVWLVKNTARKLRPGATFFSMLGLHFTLRFLAEFFKESQGVDEGWPYHLNMGHALSAPIVLVCAFMVLATKRFNVLAPLTPAEVQAEEAHEAAYDALMARTGAAAAGEEPAVETPAAAPPRKKKRNKAPKGVDVSHAPAPVGIDASREQVPVGIAVLTVSDTRTEETDASGRYLVEAATEAGHRIHTKLILPDEKEMIVAQLRAWIANDAIDVILATGGTGITGRDVTPDAFLDVMEKEIPGFGELFRTISLKAIGLAAIQSRALAGVASGTLMFALPGSTGACRDAWREILVHQLDSRYRPCNFVELLRGSASVMGLDFEAVTRALASRAPERITGDDVNKHAAVAMILRAREGDLEVLLIRRAERANDPWSGHMAFPGGGREPGDVDLVDTAVRETFEEVALSLDRDAQFLGRLDDVRAMARGVTTGLVVTRSCFRVEADVALSLSDEVSELHWAPLGPMRSGERDASIAYPWQGQSIRLPGFRIEGVEDRIVWGLTHKMLISFFARL